MSETATTTNGHPERLPDLRAEETARAAQLFRRVKAGERLELFPDEEGRVCWQPVERGDVNRT